MPVTCRETTRMPVLAPHPRRGAHARGRILHVLAPRVRGSSGCRPHGDGWETPEHADWLLPREPRTVPVKGEVSRGEDVSLLLVL